MQDYKEFIQGIGLVAITNLIVSLSSFILLPILTKNLSANNYGLWIQFTVTINLLINIVPLGLPFGMLRFLSAEKNKKKVSEDFYSIIILVIFVSIIFSSLIIVFQTPIANALFGGNTNIVILLSLTITIICLNNILINYFRTFRRMKFYSLFNILQAFLILSFVTYFILIKLGIYGALLGYTIANLIIFLIMIIIVVFDLRPKIPQFKNIKEYLSFSLPTVPGNLSYWLLDSSDRYLIGILIGNAFVGYYSPSYVLGNIIIMFLAPFSLLLPAVLPKYFDNGEMKKVKLFLKYSLKCFMLIAIPSAFGLSILSKPILNILTTPEIANNGYIVTPFVALSAIMYGLNSNINQIIILNKKTKINGSVWILAGISNIILNLFLIPQFGILGAAIATLMSYTLTVSITFYYNHKYLKFKFDFDTKFIIKSIIASILISVIILFINPSTILDVIITIIFSFIIYIFVLYIIKGINKKEIEIVREMFLK